MMLKLKANDLLQCNANIARVRGRMLIGLFGGGKAYMKHMKHTAPFQASHKLSWLDSIIIVSGLLAFYHRGQTEKKEVNDF